MFREPPKTKFDLNFSVAGFPVTVHPFFWLMGLLLGGISSGASELITWIIVIFISILIHELGHTFAFRYYGIDSSIVLHMMGGLAIPRGGSKQSLTPNQQIIVSLAGPFAGFTLVALILVAVKIAGGWVFVENSLLGFLPYAFAYLPWDMPILDNYISTFIGVNVFWGFLNLLPVYPLDGGQVTRNLFIQFDNKNGVTNSLWLSVLTGAFIAIYAIVFLKSTYTALLFGLLAFQSYQALSNGYQ